MSIVNDLIELNDDKSDIQNALVAKGVTSAGKHGFGKFAEDIASIANQYTSSDEGKVVSSGALVSQTATSTSQNGTVDTTLHNSIVISVPTDGHKVIVTTLPNAVVTISDSSNTYTATSDINGIASFTGVVAGTYTVIASIDGAQIGSTSLTVTDFTVDLLPVVVTRQVDFTNNTSPVAPSATEIAASPVYSGITRCNVADDGTILAYYGDSEYTENGSNGQVMVKIPKFWYKVNHTDSSGNTLTNGAAIDIGNWSIADRALEGYTVHPAFINANGDEVDYFLIGAFEAVFQNGNAYTSTYNSSYKMASSRGNGTLKPGANFTRATGRAAAQARGTGWYQCGIKQISAIQMLMTVEYGCNSQTAISQGYTNTNNSASTYVGLTTGNGTSDHSGDTSAVVYHGIENLWGNVYKWIEGLTTYGQAPYVYTGYSFTDTYSTGTQLAFSVPSTNYITRFGYDSTFDWVFLPKLADSSGNTMIGDRTYTSSPSTSYLASLGGRFNHGSDAGFFCWAMTYDYYGSSTNTGSRIMYVPTT